MNRHPPGSFLVGGSLIVAGLCTVVVEHGWLAWVPILLAILVAGVVKHKLNL